MLIFILTLSSNLLASELAPANKAALPTKVYTSSSQGQLSDIDQKLLTPAAQALMGLVNKERTNLGLNSLAFDPHCARAARDHAIDSGKNRLRGHMGSDGSQLQDRYQRYSSDYSMLAENWAYIQDPSGQTLTPRSLHENWMKSSGHKRNILDPSAKRIGIGLYRIGAELYAVQCFSAP